MKTWQKLTLIGCSMYVMMIVLVCVGGFIFSHYLFHNKKVHEATVSLPEFPKIDVTDPSRFLNDLKLSPLWKVEKDRDGEFIAVARSIVPSESLFDESPGMFLFEFMGMKNRMLPKDYCIRNKSLEIDETYSYVHIAVVFKKPGGREEASIGISGQDMTLDIYESYEDKIGWDSFSNLAIKLSSKYDIYVILREQGDNPNRNATLAKLPIVLQELANIARSLHPYRVEERYSEFFKLFFQYPLQNNDIKSFPGMQSSDTFYGYLRAKPNTSYSGVNIKISHPVYCPIEGTRKSSRLRKAEYLGTPYFENDILFFLIGDNTVYLSGEYDQRFGIFTGSESFVGKLEVLNDKNDILLETTDKFKCWQR